jgi:vancomycin resistance protein VanJ
LATTTTETTSTENTSTETTQTRPSEQKPASGYPNRLDEAIAVVAVLYVIGILLWVAASQTPVVHSWPYSLIGVFKPWVYMLSLPLAVVTFWRCGLRGSVWLIIPLLMFTAEYGPRFLPRGGGSGGAPIRVMTANVQYVNSNADAVASAVFEYSPDVIAVQELSSEISAPLAEKLRERYPYQELYPESSSHGMGIFSRYPITSSSPAEMEPLSCRCQQMTVDFNGKQVTIINVHPSPPKGRLKRDVPPIEFRTADNEAALRTILARADAIQEPLLILGDFNVGEGQPPYSWVQDRYRDTYGEVGSGFGLTFPATQAYGRPVFPMVRIDYIFHDEAWTSRSAWTVLLPGSDHRGVVADLSLTTQ